jgi:archaellum component FlaG (FlaF/FlaG flagellin family)
MQITVSPSKINLNLATNTNREQLIYIKNTGNATINITIRQNNLDMMVILQETYFTLKPGEVKELRVIFVALNQTGIFTGRLHISGKVIPVTLNVKSKILLFDSNIIVS